MAIEMINQYFGIETQDGLAGFFVRDLAGIHARLNTRAEAVAWIEATTARIVVMGDEPEATADEYLAAGE